MKNIIDKSDATPGSTGQLPAAEYNDHKIEIQKAVEKSGQTLNASITDQMSKALFINGAGASSVVDSGTANSVLLSPETGISGLVFPDNYSQLQGSILKFNKTVANTSTAVIVNAGQSGTELGAKNLVREDGSAISIGELIGDCEIKWDVALDKWLLLKSGKSGTVSSIAELRTKIGFHGQKVDVLGYYVAGDVSDMPSPVYDANSLADDTGGNVIRPTAIGVGAPGRWVYITERVNILHFGAKGNDIFDDYSIIQYCLDNFSYVYVPSQKVFRIETTLVLNNSGLTIEGDGIASRIKCYGCGGFNINNGFGLIINNLRLSAQDDKLYHGITNNGSLKTSIINNIWMDGDNTHGFNYGLNIPDAYQCSFTNLFIEYCNRSANLTQAYLSKIDRAFLFYSGIGLYFQGRSSEISNIDASYGDKGIIFDFCNSVLLDGVYVEALRTNNSCISFETSLSRNVIIRGANLSLSHDGQIGINIGGGLNHSKLSFSAITLQTFGAVDLIGVDMSTGGILSAIDFNESLQLEINSGGAFLESIKASVNVSSYYIISGVIYREGIARAGVTAAYKRPFHTQGYDSAMDERMRLLTPGQYEDINLAESEISFKGVVFIETADGSCKFWLDEAAGTSSIIDSNTGAIGSTTAGAGGNKITVSVVGGAGGFVKVRNVYTVDKLISIKSKCYTL